MEQIGLDWCSTDMNDEVFACDQVYFVIRRTSSIAEIYEYLKILSLLFSDCGLHCFCGNVTWPTVHALTRLPSCTGFIPPSSPK